MNTNPIKAKLQKMFGKKKKQTASIQTAINQSSCASSLNLSSLQVLDETMNLGSAYKEENKENIDQFHQQNTTIDELSKVKEQLSHYKRKTKKLEEKIEDHQLLEQFYLLQLRERDEIERELKWKLQIISEEIKSNRLSLCSARDWETHSSIFLEKAAFSQQ